MTHTFRASPSAAALTHKERTHAALAGDVLKVIDGVQRADHAYAETETGEQIPAIAIPLDDIITRHLSRPANSRLAPEAMGQFSAHLSQVCALATKAILITIAAHTAADDKKLVESCVTRIYYPEPRDGHSPHTLLIKFPEHYNPEKLLDTAQAHIEKIKSTAETLLTELRAAQAKDTSHKRQMH